MTTVTAAIDRRNYERRSRRRTTSRAVRGILALDGEATAAAADFVRTRGLAGKVTVGGFDLLPNDADFLADGSVDFVLDQQPYLQGFTAAHVLVPRPDLAGRREAPPTSTSRRSW